jgi:hypothetical protein
MGITWSKNSTASSMRLADTGLRPDEGDVEAENIYPRKPTRDAGAAIARVVVGVYCSNEVFRR